MNGTAVAVSAITKVAADLTGKTYKLTIPTLTNKEGKVTVNGTEQAFDFKSPEVTSIVAKGTKTLEVTFNEPIKDTTAIASNFKIKKISDAAVITTGTVALSADATKATISFDTDLNVADYTLTLGETVLATATNRVQDTTGNAIYGGTEVSFRPSATDLAVKEAASITTAEYNNGTGILTVAFNKDTTAANVDVTKITFGGVALTSSDLVAQSTSNSVTITLSAATKLAVNAVSGALNLVASASAWTDGTNATTGQTVSVAKVTPAVVSSAAYNQETKVLTVTFDQAVKMNTVAGIKVNSAAVGGSEATAASATNVDGTAIDTTVAQSTWTLKLSAVEAAKLESATNDKAKLKVYMATDAVRNNLTRVISNVATTYATGAIAVTYTADTTKPYATAVVYDNKTGILTLTYSEALDAASLVNLKVAGNAKIATAATGDVNAFDLSAETLTASADKKSVAITVTGANKTNLDNQYFSGKTIKAWIAADVLVDANGLKNVATTFDTGIVATYNDFVAPTVTSVTPLNKNFVTVVFNEMVQKSTAEVASNYVIKDLAGNTLQVKSAELQADGKTVYVNTADQVSGKPYNVTVSNVRDLQSNLVTVAPTAIVGNGTDATAKLGVNATLVATAPVNSKNDTLQLTFDGVVSQAQALNLANYSVLQADTNDTAGWTAAKAVSLANSKASIDATGKIVTLTLADYNLQSGKYYKVVVSNVTDVYGNTLDSTKTTAAAVVLDAANLTAPSVVEANTKDGAVVLTFDQELVATEAVKVTNYKVGAVQPTKATYAYDAATGKATVTLDLGTAVTVATNVAIKDAVTNLAGETINGATYTTNFAPITVATLTDKVAPTVKTVEATTVTGVQNDTIKVTFNETDTLKASAELAANVVVKDSKGNVVSSDKYSRSLTTDTLTLTFNGTGDNAYNLQNTDTYVVTLKNVVDTSGNEITETSTAATLAATSDATAATIAVGTLDAVNKTVQVVYNEEVDATTATNKANYVVEYSALGDFSDTVTLSPIFVSLGSDLKTALVSVSGTFTTGAPAKVRVTVKNVKDLAGNVPATSAIATN